MRKVFLASIAAALPIPAALAIVGRRFAGREAIAAFLLSPLMIPHIVPTFAVMVVLDRFHGLDRVLIGKG
jgi:ABC-type Fe3+ transport system permease subunit